MTNDEQLVLDLYCAERLAEGPGCLSLRKLWAPHDPARPCRRGTRGYYVVHTCRNRVCYRYFGLTERSRATACFEKLVWQANPHAAARRLRRAAVR